MLYNQEMSEIEVDYPFPDKELVQDKIVEQYEKLQDIKRCLNSKIQKLNDLLEYELQLENSEEYPIEKLALLNKGSNKISEEMIYSNFDEDGIPVYSSATENSGLMGRISEKCYRMFDKKRDGTGIDLDNKWLCRKSFL